MCGIAAIVMVGGDPSFPARLDRMVQAQAHRGPDGEGRWIGQVGKAQVGLAHNRLAILDLSEAGRQPMMSPDGKHVLIYNGMLYNYLELRMELHREGVRFRSQCDSEVVLHALRVWGEQAFSKFNGMWALVWLDRERGTLVLSRDRFGMKPLYLYQAGPRLYVASEIKSILVGSGEQFPLNLRVIGRYVQQSLQDAQVDTFFSGIERLPGGHSLSLKLHQSPYPWPASRCYWEPLTNNGTIGSVAQRIEAVRETFIDAVRLQLRSDVPFGVLLSGGIDSSSIAAVMQRTLGSGTDMHVFSAVSGSGQNSDHVFINRMAAHLTCRVHKVRVQLCAEQAFQLLETLTWHNDEPLGSFSNIAHYLLMQRAKQQGVTVLLSGQGADELLCGYSKYLGFYLQWLIRTGCWQSALNVLAGFIRQGSVLRLFHLNEAKRYLPPKFSGHGIDLRGPLLKGQNDCRLEVGLGAAGVVERQLADLDRLSIPKLVHYEDRISMALAREIRLPFLDHRLVNLLLPLAPEWKMRDGCTKWVFRKAMEGLLPTEILWRKDKQYFSVPERDWFKGKFRGWIESFLRGDLLTEEYGIIDRAAQVRCFRVLCRQSATQGLIAASDVFNPLALEIWLRRFKTYLRFP